MHQPARRALCPSTVALLAAGLSLSVCLAVPAQSAGILTLATTVPTGGSPRAIVVDRWSGRNDVVFYDAATQRLRFLDGDSLSLLAGSISMPTWDFRPWLVYDRYRHKVYAVTTTEHGTWDEVEAQAISDRALQATLSLNDLHNEGVPDPPDWSYGISGILLDPALSGSRLLVNCGRCGVIDALDLDATGLAASSRNRFQYRAFIEGTIGVLSGNSLARAGGLLYLGDAPGATGNAGRRSVVDVFRQGAPPATFAPAAGTDLDLYDVWPFANGYQSLAGGGSRLYVASGAASFGTGYVAEVDAARGAVSRVIELLYQDQAAVLVDWYDPKRVFVLTADDGWNDSALPLYVHLIYDGRVLASLRLLEGYDSSDGAALAFDPYGNRLYVATDGSILVIDVDSGMAPATYATGDVGPSGGTVASPDGRVRLRFGTGATTSALTVALSDARPMDTGGMILARAFEVTVSDAAGAVMASTSQPYTIETEIPAGSVGGTDAAVLSLYRWDGQSWVALAGMTSGDGVRSASSLSAVTQDTGLFAVLGQPTWRLLPMLLGKWP